MSFAKFNLCETIILPKLQQKKVLLTLRSLTYRLFHMPQLNTIPTASAASTTDFSGKTAVVIDVLRATSVITTALAMGAHSVIPAGTIEEAMEIYRAGNEDSLLCGERDAMKIEGFQLGNSPLEYTSEIVAGKRIILCTSNGTKAIRACKSAEKMIILSFLNMGAVVDLLAKERNEIVLVCSGTNGKFSLDDALCAGVLINRLSLKSDLTSCDLSKALSLVASTSPNDLMQALKGCFHLDYLLKRGFAEDVEFCLRMDVFPSTPLLFDNSIKIIS